MDEPEVMLRLESVSKSFYSQAAEIEILKNADFKIGMRIQRRQAEIIALGSDIVEQQAHPDPPVRCCQQFAYEQVTRQIIEYEIVLRIDAAFGQACQDYPCGQGFYPVVDQNETGFAGVQGSLARNSLSERGIIGIAQGITGLTGLIEIQRGTTCAQQYE